MKQNPKIKQKTQQTCTKLLLAGILSIASSFTTATDGKWFINPTIGYQSFDNDRYLDDDELVGLALEYHYNKDLGVELKYFNSSPDGDSGNVDADLNQLMIEGLKILDNYGQFQPHLAIGLGHADFDYDTSGSDKETQITAGGGVRYWLSERWSTKADLRAVYSVDEGDTDQLLTLAVSYAFGNNKPNQTSKRTPIQKQLNPSATPIAVTPINKPLKDSDSDGIIDSMDQCPNTSLGKKVDETGCIKKLVVNKTISIDVKFASASHIIAKEYLDEIGKVANFMQQYPGVSGVIEGHTDSVGASTYNKQLSQRRANAVRQVLVELFEIKPERLDAVGYGEEKPVADNNTAEGRSLNRRVVAVFGAEVTEYQE